MEMKKEMDQPWISPGSALNQPWHLGSTTETGESREEIFKFDEWWHGCA